MIRSVIIIGERERSSNSKDCSLILFPVVSLGFVVRVYTITKLESLMVVIREVKRQTIIFYFRVECMLSQASWPGGSHPNPRRRMINGIRCKTWSFVFDNLLSDHASPHFKP